MYAGTHKLLRNYSFICPICPISTIFFAQKIFPFYSLRVLNFFVSLWH